MVLSSPRDANDIPRSISEENIRVISKLHTKAETLRLATTLGLGLSRRLRGAWRECVWLRGHWSQGEPRASAFGL